jgi:four helix bundle protein
MNRFKELIVWQKSIDLVEEVYKISCNFPVNEKFGITSQINRSSVSIASNIAEGAGRNSQKEFKNFLSIALGSCFELETQIIIAGRLNFVALDFQEDLLRKIQEIQKMIYGLQKTLI